MHRRTYVDTFVNGNFACCTGELVHHSDVAIMRAGLPSKLCNLRVQMQTGGGKSGLTFDDLDMYYADMGAGIIHKGVWCQDLGVMMFIIA